MNILYDTRWLIVFAARRRLSAIEGGDDGEASAIRLWKDRSCCGRAYPIWRPGREGMQPARLQITLEFTHFLSSEMHRALENEGRSTFRQVVFSGCLEENSEGLQRGLRYRSA